MKRKSCTHWDRSWGCKKSMNCGPKCRAYMSKKRAKKLKPCAYFKQVNGAEIELWACTKERFRIISACPKECKRRWAKRKRAGD
jgi:hypothetical protein